MDAIRYKFEYRRVSADTAFNAGYPKRGKPRDGELQTVAQIKCDLSVVYPRGGMTICFASDGGLVGVGVAVCSYSDTFNRKVGRELARKRAEIALRALQINTDKLTALIEGFLEHAAMDAGKPVQGYSFTVGGGQASAMLSWENRPGKKAE